MKEIASLQSIIKDWETLTAKIYDLSELAELDDDSILGEIITQLSEINRELADKELAVLRLANDHGNAILAIHAGAGGTDSQDWAAMLERMYLRWAERRGFGAEIIDRTEGEEAGIKSVTILISGDLAYGYLRPEKGVHRLVRLSPFDAAHRRHILRHGGSIADINMIWKLTFPGRSQDRGLYPPAPAARMSENMTAVRIVHIPSWCHLPNERSSDTKPWKCNESADLRLLRSKKSRLKHCQNWGDIKSGMGNQIALMCCTLTRWKRPQDRSKQAIHNLSWWQYREFIAAFLQKRTINQGVVPGVEGLNQWPFFMTQLLLVLPCNIITLDPDQTILTSLCSQRACT